MQFSVELHLREMEAMRKEIERSIDQARLETELVGRESREELQNGLRVVHGHLKSVDEKSHQQRSLSHLKT